MIKGALVFGAGAALAGALYEWWGERRDARRYPPPGRMVQGLHLYEMGTHGPPVILEAGLATTSLNWRSLQETLAGFTRCVAYDRAGLGWSEPSRTPRIPSQIAAELRAALRTAQVEPPYILVGHSFGGLVVRRFALDFPEEVAGLVLLDPLTVEEADALRDKLHVGVRVARGVAVLARVGLVRIGLKWLPRHAGKVTRATRVGFLQRMVGEIGKMPRKLWPMIAAHWSNPRSFVGIAAQFAAVAASADEMRHAPPVRGIPVSLLTAGKGGRIVTAQEIQAVGTEVRHVVASRSGHWIHLDEPELVVDAVRRLAALEPTVANGTSSLRGASDYA